MTTPLYRPTLLIDALQIPLIGRVLRSRRGRLALQLSLLSVCVLLIYDGFTGEQIASRNLATVSTWVHYRGLVVLALLMAGNLFCMGCPFTIPRTLARKLSIRGRRFPDFLRNKWLAIGGLFLFFWLYEWLDLWASPLLTAWVIIAYFVASLVLEAVFTESAFCKYVCPLGTFNFAYSTTSPLQITAKDRKVCRTCVGKECVNGSYSAQPVILIDEIGGGQGVQPIRQHTNGPDGVLGCGTLLFVPQIKSNMDCTMCLDCVRACPHDNVALAVRSPLREILDVSLWQRRWDTGFLFIALAFMGLINAFGMIPPVYALLNEISRLTTITNMGVLTFLLFFGATLLLPAVLGVGAAWLSARLAGARKDGAVKSTFVAFAPAFVPIGLGIWASHYAFHFFTGALTILPVFQNFMLDHGITVLGSPNWELASLLPLEVVNLLELLLLLGGYLVSTIAARRIATKLYSRPAAVQRAWMPWAVVMLAMILFAAWVMSQPMEMRAVG